MAIDTEHELLASRVGIRWIVVRDRARIVGDVYATGRRKALEKLRVVFGGERHGTGAFNEVLIRSELGGHITVWRPKELEDPRLFDTPPERDPRVRINHVTVRRGGQQ